MAQTMGKTSDAMIAALDNADPSCDVVESSIIGTEPDDGEEGSVSLAIAIINRRSELSILIFSSHREVMEFCAGMQQASEAMFEGGGLQPERVSN